MEKRRAPNKNLQGKLLQAYCDLCEWQGEVRIPTSYRPPTCGPMEQSCPYCGTCYLHPMPNREHLDGIMGMSYLDWQNVVMDEE